MRRCCVESTKGLSYERSWSLAVPVLLSSSPLKNFSYFREALRNSLQAKKHISPKLIERAAEAGIELKILNPEQPLEDQEPFNVVLHKIRNAGADLSLWTKT